MPVITQHSQGTFCWPELATTDAAAGKKFYSALFGWEPHDTDMGPNGFYTIFRLGDREAAACYTLMQQMSADGVPPNWGAYIAVEDADATVAKIPGLGGKLIQGPFEVMDFGRMAICSDPIGAIFCVWQARKHIGISVAGEPGALGWAQLNGSNPERTKDFYAGLFGWTFVGEPMEGGTVYTTCMRADGVPVAGMMPMPPEVQAPAHWLSYFVVKDVDATTAQAAALGAKTYVAPRDVQEGLRIAVLADPQGAVFGLMTSM